MDCKIAVLDYGTSSIKAGVIDFTGRTLGFSRIQAPSLTPTPGRNEIFPASIRNLALDTLREAVTQSGSQPADVCGVCITGQRASFLGLDDAGVPLGNAVSWQDSRGSEEIRLLQERMDAAEFRSLTGLPLNPVFTLAKLMWVLRQDQERGRKIRRVVTIPDFLLRELGADDIVTDHANASLTGMFDITRRAWSEPILAAAGIPLALLPRPVCSGSRVGTISRQASGQSGLLPGTPLFAGAGDHQCAGIGAGALEPGIVELALGTAGVPLMTLEQLPTTLVPGLMYCCHGIPGQWEVEGFQNSAGAALAWGNQMLGTGVLPTVQDPEPGRPGSHGLLFLPYLCGGSSAPYWNPDAKGVFLGLTIHHTPADLAQAILEGILLECSNVLQLFSTPGMPVREIRVTGGCSRIPRVPRLLAGVTGLPIRVPLHSESGLMGAALLAAVGTGGFPSLSAAASAMVHLGPAVTASEADQEACAILRNQYRSVVSAFETGRIFSLQG